MPPDWLPVLSDQSKVWPNDPKLKSQVRSVINDDQPGEWLWIFGNDVEAVNGVPFVTAATLTDCDGCHVGDNKVRKTLMETPSVSDEQLGSDD